jgi:hypothetical protein
MAKYAPKMDQVFHKNKIFYRIENNKLQIEFHSRLSQLQIKYFSRFSGLKFNLNRERFFCVLKQQNCEVYSSYTLELIGVTVPWSLVYNMERKIQINKNTIQ